MDTLVEQCYDQLKEAIIRGELKPGEKLRIAKLKTVLNAGPTPIREALSRLIFSGLIAPVANRGFFVKKVSLEEVQDIYGTFEKIELLALSEAIHSGDVAWEGAILAALHRLNAIEKGSPLEDSKAWLQANYDFHRSLVSGCRSPCLLKIREDLYLLFERYCHLSFLTEKQNLKMHHEHHVRIAQAVIQRQAAEACQLMQEHLRTSFESVIHHLFK